MRNLILAALGVAMGGLASPSAQATPIVSPLNCTIISGTTTCPNNLSGTYGSLTFDQLTGTTNTVSILVSLTSPATIQDIFLNLADAVANNFSATIGGSPVALAISQNNEFPNGAGNTNEGFDLVLPPTGTLTQNGSTFTILLTDNTSNFAPNQIAGLSTPNGILDAAVHLQNCNNIGVCTTSLVVGENATTGGGPGTVPEPASMAMLGVGLIGLGYARRRVRT